MFHLYRGSELLQDNRVHEAKEELEQALKLQPRDAKGQDLLAVVYFRLGLYPRSIEIYEELIRDFPSDAPLTLNLALCYLKTGQPEKARTLLENLVLTQSDHQRAWSYLGLVHERLGDYEKARAAFERGHQPGMARRMEELLAAAVPPRSLSVPPPDPKPPFESFHDLARETTLVGMPTAPRRTVAPAPVPDLPLESSAVEPPAEAQQPATSTPDPVSIVPHRTISVGSDPLPAGGAPRLASDAFAPLVPAAAAPSALAGLSESRLAFDVPKLLQLTRDTRLVFPGDPKVTLDPSGLTLVHLESTFASRVSAIHLMSPEAPGFVFSPLPRRMRNRAVDEPLGGAQDPIVSLSGRGGLALSAPPGERLVVFEMEEDFLFVRESILVGFASTLTYENGRLAAFEGEAAALVQLRGHGGVVLRTQGAIVSTEVHPESQVVLAREAILGWQGRLLPRELTKDESPGGVTRLVSFTGTGWVLSGTEMDHRVSRARS